MVEKKENNGVWKYFWTAGGMLKAVQRPDGSVISFKYDAFGRRISKTYHRREFLYIWDKNVPLHEIQKEELCEDNIITWIFEGFTPTAKLINGKAYSIISDHLGTPILAIDTQGYKVWERELDIYGKVRKEFTHDSVKDRRSGFMPFLYAGQYYDKETDLGYNRFRYYSTDTGAYISQDPIGLAGGNPTLYGYVFDGNTEVDVFGLDILYRSMCREEYYDIKDVGWRSNGGMEGKWFADSFEGAMKFGNYFGHGDDNKYYIVTVEVPNEITKAAYKDKDLDNLNGSTFFENETLNEHAKIKEVNSIRVKCKE